MRELLEKIEARQVAARDQADQLREQIAFHRPHGARGGQTPYERLKQKTETQV
ncbi:hypothetical protein ACIBCA_01235 [Kitasatospora sp. NPDC051170]|uniref:hypothetical protein n=1 Tax=Kitasatospora sp. NPDC051170 TaxID=3364056 RepID=UPI0037B6D680